MTITQVQTESGTPAPRDLSVSVVIPTCNRAPDLERCLAAVAGLRPAPDEVVVVDSAPRSADSQEIASHWHARYVREDLPGASRARNRGAREATGDIVAYTDDDAVPDCAWLGPLAREFADPRVALVAGRVVPPAAEPGLDQLYELAGFKGQGEDRVVIDRHTPRWFEKVNFLPFGIAPNLAIRRSVFRHWSGFDERLGPGTSVPGHEEQRAFLQLIKLGFRLVYAPTAYVMHPLPARSVEELRLRSVRRMQASSAYLTLLMLEEPRHLREILGYVCQKLISRGGGPQNPGGSGLPKLRRVLARLQGPGLYFRSRSQRPGALAGAHGVEAVRGHTL